MKEFDIKNQNSNTMDNTQNYTTIIIIFNIIIGQVLALIGVGNAAISKIIENDLNFVIPLLLTASYYLLLFLFWIIVKRKIKYPKFSYILITIFDSQANFLNIYAFSVIHFNYPFIINVSCVFWTCIFTCLFIKKYRYTPFNIIGVVVTLLGVIITLVGTFTKLSDAEIIFDNLKGLLLCLAASVCYSISAILQDIYFKLGQDIYEFFPWMGIIGFILTFSESFLLDEVSTVIYKYTFSWKIGLLWAGFAITLVTFNSIAPFFIKRCSASMFNISLVSQIIWSYVVEIVFWESVPKGYVYYIGFIVIIIGIYIFTKYPVVIVNSYETLDNESNKTNLLEKNKQLNNNDNLSDTGSASSSGFSAERKFTYYKNSPLSVKANKYLNV